MAKNVSEKIKEFQRDADQRREAIYKEYGLIGNGLDGVRIEGIQYTHLGGTIFVPVDKAASYTERINQFSREQDERFRECITMDECISHELGNHEAYYTWMVDDAMEAVKEYYPEVTKEDMWRVFNLNKHKYE